MVGPRWAHSSVPGLLYWADHRDRLGDRARSVDRLPARSPGLSPARSGVGRDTGTGSRHGGVTRDGGLGRPKRWMSCFTTTGEQEDAGLVSLRS